MTERTQVVTQKRERRLREKILGEKRKYRTVEDTHASVGMKIVFIKGVETIVVCARL